MSKKNNAFRTWIEAGYSLFAERGLDGIQVEILSRSVNLNKSGFYHYFGDREGFLKEMMKHHYHQAERLAIDIGAINIKRFAPDFVGVLLRYATPVMLHMQLVRYRHDYLMNEWFETVNKLVDPTILPGWSAFIGIPEKPDIALRYFEIVRDTFYARVTAESMNEAFLRELLNETRGIVTALLRHGKEVESGRRLRLNCFDDLG